MSVPSGSSRIVRSSTAGTVTYICDGVPDDTVTNVVQIQFIDDDEWRLGLKNS
jgi:hypothetical protein